MTTLIVAKMMKSIMYLVLCLVQVLPSLWRSWSGSSTEDCKLGVTTNPYGSTKAMMERILTDVQFANPEMSVTLLVISIRIGAHESGLIGENQREFQIT